MIVRTQLFVASVLLAACGPSDWGPPVPATPVPVFGDTTGVQMMRLRVGDTECSVIGEPAERQHFCDLPKALPQGNRIRFHLQLQTASRQIEIEREVSVPPATAWTAVWIYADAEPEPEIELSRVTAPPEGLSLERNWLPVRGGHPSYRITNRQPAVLWPRSGRGVPYGGKLFVAWEKDGEWVLGDDARAWDSAGLKQLLPNEEAVIDTQYGFRGVSDTGWARFATWVREEAELDRGIFLHTDYLLVDEVLVQEPVSESASPTANVYESLVQ